MDMTDVMLKTQLENVGLSGLEIKVYLYLLGIGKAKAGEIISNLHLHRHLVYRSLDKLEQRQLISKKIEPGGAIFSVNDPGRLLEEIDLKRNEVSNLVEELRTQHHKTQNEVTIYQGIDGIAMAATRALRLARSGPAYILGGSNVTETSGLGKYWRIYHEERAKRKIQAHMLFNASTDPEIIRHRNSYPFTDARLLPPGLEPPAWFYFIGDAIMIEIPLGEKPLSIYIKDAQVAETMRQYFSYFWDKSAKHP